VAGAKAEIEAVQAMGGAVAAVESRLHEVRPRRLACPQRRQRIEAGEDVVVGVNQFTSTEPNPLTADLDTAIQTVDPAVEEAAARAVGLALGARLRCNEAGPGRTALARLQGGRRRGANLMAASLECARAKVTTGEWAGGLREEFGEYRAPTGVSGSVVGMASATPSADLAEVRD
jgi:(2R)-ethylmalonyl-CoA mutase